jgi:iron complex transport system ATP-binding protein
MSAPLLEVRGLRIEVPRRVLVDSFDATARSGEFIGVLGANGAGKSLLLRTLAGLRQPEGGTVHLEGAALPGLSRREIATRLGFLPQDPDAPPQGNLFESVLLGRHAHLGFWESSGDEDQRRATQALREVGLADFVRRELTTLSGGEQRRAAMARLLVQSPAIYLLDEPTNHLDPAQQLGILETFRALARSGAVVVASLHDPNLALRFADQVWLMGGDGRVDTITSEALETRHLARLYGIDYAEARLDGLRLMAPVSAARSR